MSESITSQIRALRRMTVAELREKHLELFGAETRSRHKTQLFKRLAWRVQELAYGSLSERTKRRALEIGNDLDCRSLPPRKPGNGGNGSGRVFEAHKSSSETPLTPGTIISREYRGEVHQALVMEDGAFEYRGQRFKSLSGLARAITNTNWNGYLFFNLKKRGNGNGRSY